MPTVWAPAAAVAVEVPAAEVPVEAPVAVALAAVAVRAAVVAAALAVVAVVPVEAVGTLTTDAWSATPPLAARVTIATIPTITRVSPAAGLAAKAVPTPLVRSLAAAKVETAR